MDHLADHAEAVRTARRQLATVLVDGLGAAGIRIAEQLIELGIGTVLLRDERAVTAADGAYRITDRGRTRAESACRRLRPRDASSAVLEAPEGAAFHGLDLHVVVADREPACGRLRTAGQSDSAALPVELSASGFCIGPVLTTGGGVCAECLVLYGLSEDRAPAAAPAHTGPSGAGGAATAIAAGIAAHQVQVLVDGDSPAAAQSGALIGHAATGRIDHCRVDPHPECRCRTYLSADRHEAEARRRRRHRPHTTSAEVLHAQG